MSKPAPLSSMIGEIAGLVTKGEAAPAPAAAIAPPPPAVVKAPRAPQPQAAPPARDVLRRPTRRLERTQPPPPPRGAARVQVGLRLDPERHEQLRRISFELRESVQTVIEEALIRWMDEFDAGEGG